jgi:lipopolysaccharide/colanic/teichoic acid biosynthesis glycosyltransferase
MRRDPRVTKVGRFLRRTSLDELPQLWNVLRGEMSLIGPSPPLPEEVASYTERQLKRLQTVPGMTGIWQISGRSQLGFDEMVKLDLYYVDNWSVWLDLSILVLTIPAALSRKGAY